jgi:hypothetical protein
VFLRVILQDQLHLTPNQLIAKGCAFAPTIYIPLSFLWFGGGPELALEAESRFIVTPDTKVSFSNQEMGLGRCRSIDGVLL